MFKGKKNMGAGSFLYPTPLVLCGTYDSSGRPNLATLAWAGICCSEPPAVQISIRKQRHTYSSIIEKKEFTVNIPSIKHTAEADFCGMASGRSVDKFDRARLTPLHGQFVDAPIVDEFPFCLECRLLHTFIIGSHDIFIGEILASWVREDCLSDDGGPDPLKMAPMVYTPTKGGGIYYTIGDACGKAFDAGKSLMETVNL
ncbi:MAG: flavin reductase family protein [Synergistaceae bacterium]|jgi:flavin reductase (DIM6/NTAB) family NADH-FMN oxidoreductase RutF|nr:flavin reductase family protein [Synergistaceae bacterium]